MRRAIAVGLCQEPRCERGAESAGLDVTAAVDRGGRLADRSTATDRSRGAALICHATTDHRQTGRDDRAAEWRWVDVVRRAITVGLCQEPRRERGAESAGLDATAAVDRGGLLADRTVVPDRSRARRPMRARCASTCHRQTGRAKRPAERPRVDVV